MAFTISDDKKLYVVLVCYEWGSSKGGISSFNRYLAIGLAKQPKFRVQCLVSELLPNDKNKAAEKGVELILKKPDSDQEIELPVDVVISHGRKFGPEAESIKRKRSNCRWIHFVHVDCEDMGKYKEGNNEYAENIQKHWTEVDLCKAADVVVAVGPQLQEKYSRYLSREQKTVEVFYPGLIKELEKLPQNNMETTEFYVSIFGRASAEDFKLKGFDIVADAVGRLGKAYRVYAVGVPSGEETKMIVRTINTTLITKSQLNVHPYCIDQGRLEEMMCKMDLVVMPSRAEGFGLIGLEALSAGIPVLVSEVSGFGRTLKDLPFGHTCVVESEDLEEWAERIRLLKERKRSMRNEEIKAIRDRYGAIYQWDDQCSKLAALFTKDLGRVGPGAEGQGAN